jgi:tryptophan halogenase
MRIGRSRNSWVRNCVAIGLSSGFVEPLESTGIFFIQHGIEELVNHFPRGTQVDPNMVRSYNQTINQCIDGVRQFLTIHYAAGNRDDTPYWDYCRNMQVPDYLAEKIRLFESYGRVFRENDELFNDTSWFAVMVGQGLKPRAYDPLVDVLPDEELRSRMSGIKTVLDNCAAQMPDHWEFIARNCAATT